MSLDGALRSSVTAVLFAGLLVLCLNAPSSAQTDGGTDDFPPPLKTISKSEKKALESESDPKKRTMLSIELIEARLKKAETSSAQSAYRQMFFELGVLQGLIENSLAFLYQANRGTDKDFDNFKKFEMALRTFTPRVEILRRESPERYDRYLQSVLKQIRDARSKAVEPLFGDRVVPQVLKKNENP